MEWRAVLATVPAVPCRDLVACGAPDVRIAAADPVLRGDGVDGDVAQRGGAPVRRDAAGGHGAAAPGGGGDLLAVDKMNSAMTCPSSVQHY